MSLCRRRSNSSNVTVEVTDVFPPVWHNCPASFAQNISAGDVDGTVVVWVEPTATDNRNVTFNSSNIQPGSLFNLTLLPLSPPVQVVYTAVDAANNEGTCRFNVSVMDVQAPSIVCRGPLTVGTDAGKSYVTATAALLNASFSDNDPQAALLDLTSQQRQFEVGTYNVTRTAVDRSGNNASCVIALTVKDMEPPSVVCNGNSINRTTVAIGGRVFGTWSNATSVRDNVNMSSIVTYDTTDGGRVAVAQNFSILVVGPTTTRTLQTVFTDTSGLNTTCDFEVQFIQDVSSTAGSSTASLLPIIAGVGAGGGLLLVLVVVLYRRSKRRRALPHDFRGILDMMEAMPGSDGPVKPREIRREHVKIVGNLGKGNFGTVDKGLLDEQRALNIPPYLVAIKQLLAKQQEARILLLEEAAIMAQFLHPHCVRLIGVVTVGDPLMVRIVVSYLFFVCSRALEACIVVV